MAARNNANVPVNEPKGGVDVAAARLARDIFVVLAVKVLLLASGFWFFFGPDQRLDVTPGGVHEHLSPTKQRANAEEPRTEGRP